jgi:hypothetical protein
MPAICLGWNYKCRGLIARKKLDLIVIASKSAASAPFNKNETVIANERPLRVKQSLGYTGIASAEEHRFAMTVSL